MLASTWLDLVVGVDIHFEMVPTPAPVPTPFPHPFVGMVFDPAGLAVSLALSNAIGIAKGGSFKGPVLINCMPATTTGTNAKNSMVLPHFVIPPGTAWTPMPKAPKPALRPGAPPSPPDSPVAPAGDAVMIVGSKTVHSMGSNQCRLGDLAMSCAEPVRLPSSQIITIPKGAPVLVGGPPAVDWMAAFMAFIKTKSVANLLYGWTSRIRCDRLRNLLDKGVCFLTGHPVDVAAGRVLTSATDVELPGRLGLVLARDYASSWSHRPGVLGWGWSHSLDQAVWIEPGKVVYRAEDGREVEFDAFDLPDHAMRRGDELYDPVARLTLRSEGQFRWQVETHEGHVHEFGPLPGDETAVEGQAGGAVARLLAVRDRHGNALRLRYDARGRPERVTDGAGRVTLFEHDALGRLTRVLVQHPSADGWRTGCRYVYSVEGDLAEAHDAAGAVTRYEYEGHLLVRETGPTGLSFHFGYDGAGADARCVRTWGDGGLYDHEIVYDTANRVTAVTDSLGATTLYYANEAGAVVKVVSPTGAATRYEYDGALRRTAFTDALDHRTEWAYDPRGNCVRVQNPDGAVTELAYDEGNRLARVTNALGAVWHRRYDPAGNLVERENPLGERVRYRWDARGLLLEVERADGARTWLERDEAGNLAAFHGPDGVATWYDHDRLGRVTLLRDALGHAEETHYDPCGRVAERRERDGNVRTMRYDAAGNLVELRDRTGVVATLEYAGFHKLAARTLGGGAATVRYRWDTEGRLREIENEAGEVYRYERDAAGNVVAETGFDGRTRRYERDELGRIRKVTRASGAWAEFAYDPCGRVVKQTRSDGGEDRYRYRPDGAMVEAANGAATVRFERDPLGRILYEMQDEEWVGSQYDPGGARVAVESSLGARQWIRRDAAGDAAALEVGVAGAAAEPWRADFTRDPMGREIERRLPGGVATHWQRDSLGRPVARWVTHHATAIDAEGYRWGELDRLDERVDASGAVTRLDHDARDRLVGAVDVWGHAQYLAPDATGNVYRRPDRMDREYGPGGELRAADGARYVHDADGQLVEKVLPDGARWGYAYDATGMLREVRRPDGERVTFEYDALGRRVRKTAGGHTTAWLWDGNVMLHERAGDGAPVTWVFAPESFTPVGRVQAEVRHGIVTDHLGAPTAMFDEAGALAWQAQLDLRGVATTTAVDGGVDCPWRRPGQYADAETGLYYNRFRYYDPEAGRYISPDPLGPVAGTNPYRYVNDPLTHVDPFGLDDCASGQGDETSSPALADPAQKAHLETFRDGGSYLVPESAYQRRVVGSPTVGRPDGQFITTRAYMDQMLAETGHDLNAIKQRLGIPDDCWNEPLRRVNVENPLLHNARLPTGTESGANALFVPGGYTSGGMPEIVVNPPANTPGVVTISDPIVFPR